jgi:acetoin utilization deacetylase AcuC-like enzyme
MLRIAYSPIYQHPLPEGHRFPMDKYELIPKQLLHEGLVDANQFFEPTEAHDRDILLTHTSEYLYSLESLSIDTQHIRRIGFPLSKQLIQREKTLLQGTLDCARYAIKYGVSMNIAGGTHHAFSNKGEGFCLMNDMAFAANVLLNENPHMRILICDLDVHQGNGTAAIFKNEPRVFTFSMHGGDNYPFIKEQSDLDVPLEKGTSDKEYLNALEKNLEIAIELSQPQLIFYLCGVDILETDRYGKLQVTEKGCRQRDEMVFLQCKKMGIPVACAMGGGYSTKISDIVNAHCHTFKTALNIFF